MTNYRRLFQQGSYVFITVVTHKRRPILVENIELLRKAFKNSKSFFDYEIFGICILPDHFHTIIKPANIQEYPRIIYSIKYYFSRNLNIYLTNLEQSKIKKQEKGIWQRRYYEHTILNNEELQTYLDYIHFNPVKHNLTKSVANWECSSFLKFVKKGFYNINWGNYEEEIKSIENLNFE